MKCLVNPNGCEIKFLTNKKGFTLLEAMVSMLLVATVGLAVFSWINTGLVGINRVRDHSLRRQASYNALEYMKSINPMEKGRGEKTFGEFTISWDARLFEPERTGVGYPGGISRFTLGLYKTIVKVTKDDEKIAEFVLRQVGYHKDRENSFGL